MSTGYPTPYSPETDFSALSEFDKALLDPELDALATFSEHVVEILQYVLRDDWNLADGLVTFEALSPEVQALIAGGSGWTGDGPFVATLEGLTGIVDLDGENGITIVVDGQKITIRGPDPSGVLSINGEEGAVTLAVTANTGLTLSNVGPAFTLAGDLASQAEAEAGADNTVLMTPLRVAQYVAAVLVGYAQLDVVQAWTKGQYVTPFEIPWSATPSVDFDQSNNFEITLEGDTELDATQLHEGQTGRIVVMQDSTGGWALTFTPTFANQDAPVEINTEADSKTILEYYVQGGLVYLSSVFAWGEMQVIGARCQNNVAVPNSRFDIQCTSVVMRGTRNTTKVFHDFGAAITCDIGAGRGINKRDQVANFDPDVFIYWYIISNGVDLATIASTSPPPTGPELLVSAPGYTHWALAGITRHNGSSQLDPMYVRGNEVFYAERQDTAIVAAAAYAALDLSEWVPPEALTVKVNARAYVRTRDDLLTSSLVQLSIDGVNEYTRVFAESGSTVGTNESDVSDNDSIVVDMPCPDQEIFYGYVEDEDGSDADAYGFIYVLGYKIPNGGE